MSHYVTIRFDFSDTSKYASIPLYIGFPATFIPFFIYIQSELSPLGEQLLRKDLKELCALFRHLGKDSLIIACLAYQVGPYRLLGYGKMPKSTLVRKLESGNRDIYADFVKYCHYKGKKIPSIERRRKEEYERLFVP